MAPPHNKKLSRIPRSFKNFQVSDQGLQELQEEIQATQDSCRFSQDSQIPTSFNQNQILKTSKTSWVSHEQTWTDWTHETLAKKGNPSLHPSWFSCCSSED